jgi:hypothetical protein
MISEYLHHLVGIRATLTKGEVWSNTDTNRANLETVDKLIQTELQNLTHNRKQTHNG